jgi:hypothetical protein
MRCSGPLHSGLAPAVSRPLIVAVCARHGTERARCKSSCQVFAEPKARRRARASTVRWGLEEAQSKRAGRRTGTGYEVWCTRDERARDREVLHPQGGVLYKSGVYARNVLCLTLGDLLVVQENKD